MTDAALAQWINALIRTGQIKKFYDNALWLHLRTEVLNEQHHECQLCKAKGLAEPATVVHHAKHVRRYPWLALTKGNLIAICDDCHYKIHHNYAVKKQLNEERW